MIADTINSMKQHIEDAYGIVEEKGGTIPDNKNLENMADSIGSISGGGEEEIKFTGHYDEEGLKAIGYDDETIDWYQKNGVFWNEEEDDSFKLTIIDKSLYGLTENDIIQGTGSLINKKQYDIIYMPFFDVVKINYIYAFHRYNMKTIPKLDTSEVVNMQNMFNNCYSLITIPLLDTSNVTIMANMFSGCSSLTTIPSLEVSKVISTASMFSGCSALKTIPLLNTSKVNNMSYMFSNCGSLKTIPLLDTPSVTNMSYMFYDCWSLTTIPLLDTSKVTDASNMFYNCYSLTTIPLIDTSKASKTLSMFYNCYMLREIPAINLKASYNYNYLFYNCYKLSRIDLTNIQIASSCVNMFYNCGTKCMQSEGAYADGIPYVFVENEEMQSWILNSATGNNHPTTWSTANVVIAGSADDPR